ncbi:MAG: helix-turn-helix domain-containing protein [Sphingobacterium sp.]|uniref:helix-turn-helix domain-containing protein n=1 Tax=Sphingobacterium sp. JB170 TaxID=1434842 RepID=UPI00097F4ADE|nr:helix-turn-helix domain-containing protein [Sphingobacterium sp. JB170]SJN20045.1 Transcriptional regulator [Sphingobacterium sp. JB170]
MISLITPLKAQKKIAQYVRERRLIRDLTQQGLSQRSGVPLATLRKFEQKGAISLASLLKLLAVVGGLEEIADALKPSAPKFRSIDEVLNENTAQIKKRGNKT